MSDRLFILLAEDNQGDVLLIRAALEEASLSFELFVASDGDQVRSFLRQLDGKLPCPDLLLFDLNLPRVEGPELFRRVRQHPLCAAVPLIVVTSSDSPKDRAWTQEFNIAYYFRKPSDYDQYMKLGEIVRAAVTGQDTH